MAQTRQWVASCLVVATFLASVLTQSASAYYFESYVKWANKAVSGGPLAANCSLAAVGLLDFVYAVVNNAPASVGTADLTHTCTSCSSALDTALSLLPRGNASICPILPYSNDANRTATALRRFVCLGSGNAAAGSCVVHVVNALSSIGLLDRVKTLDTSLRFDESVLPRLCSALWPPEPAAASGSCCGRTWALLMAALTQQMCLQPLSQEYASLPGRCTAFLNETVPGYCEANWATDLLPLLMPPPSTVCETTTATTATTNSGSSNSSGSVILQWLHGNRCSTTQLAMADVVPSSSCDLWCGVLGAMAQSANGGSPGPQNANATGNGSSTSGTSPPLTDRSVEGGNAGGGGGGGGGSPKLQTVTIVIICIFSVLIAGLLMALAVFLFALYKERRALKREQYQFDVDLSEALPETEDTKPLVERQPPQQPPPPSAAAQAGPSSAGPAGSDPATPARHNGSGPVEAIAAAATVGSIIRTPRYAPGPPPAAPPGPAAESMAAEAVSPTQLRRLSNGSSSRTAARSITFGSAAHSTTTITATSAAAAAATSAAAAAAADTVSRSSVTSRYESAMSLLDKSTPLTASSRRTPRAPMRCGSDGNLLMVAPTSTSLTSGRTATASASATGGAADRLRSHRLSLSGSEIAASVYQTAYSRDSYYTATGVLDPSGSYATVRSTFPNIGGDGAGGGGGGGDVPRRAGSVGALGALASSPPR